MLALVQGDKRESIQGQVQEKQERDEAIPDEVDATDLPHVSDNLHHVSVLEEVKITSIDERLKEAFRDFLVLHPADLDHLDCDLMHVSVFELLFQLE